jgi:capsular exopolysaccharide synthesis family protein
VSPEGEGASSRSEAYRVLRSNLLVSLGDLERPTVIITSADAGEGKTVTAVNTARSLALAGKRVVLVDLDLRHPNVHRWLPVHNEFGVTDVLLDRRPIDECLQYVEVAGGQWPRGLYVLPTGGGVENPAELLGIRRTGVILEALATQADVVLIDTPPVLLVADTLVIGRMTAGAVLVVEARRTPIAAVQHAKDALIRNQTRILGVVLNKFQAKDADDAAYGYYGYGYGYPANGDRQLDPMVAEEEFGPTA